MKTIYFILEIIMKKILNPLILWCFGWKRKKEAYAGTTRILYQDPKTGYWWIPDAAIIVCENRIYGN